MRRRMILMLAAMGVFILVIGAVKFMQIRAAMAAGASYQPPPEAVTTIVTKTEQWSGTLSAIGTVAAVQGVVVSADLPGIVERIHFDSGRSVRAGQVLVRLDTSQERAQLAAAEAQRELTQLNLKRMRKLREREVVSEAELDRADAEARQALARAQEIRAVIERKEIRAPFDGALGIRQINLGQYLNGGDPVVPLQSMDPVYVNFDLPQQDVASLRIGGEVRVLADSIALKAVAHITAINSVVDRSTRTVQVQATVRNQQLRMRPGMFVEVQAASGGSRQVIALPASAVSYAPYGNSVFVVDSLKAPNGTTYPGVSQRFVTLGSARGDQVSVVSGLAPGEVVVTSGVFKLRNGAAIFVNNKTLPGNDPAPKPEDS